MKETFYFSHDTNAFNDPKIKLLVHEFGIWSYAAFWVLIELIAQSDEFKLLLKDLDRVVYVMVQGKSVAYTDSAEVIIDGVYGKDSLEEAGRHYIDLELCRKFIAKLFAIGLLCCDDKYVWSSSFNARMLRRVEIAAKRSAAGKIGNAMRWGKDPEVANAISQNRKHRKGKESKVKEIYTNDFLSVWQRYPKKLGMKQAFKSFKLSTNGDLTDINKALDNYLQHIKGKEEQFISYGSTWFNNWKDWVDYTPPNVSTGPAGREL
jgi:hypothetical protein